LLSSLLQEIKMSGGKGMVAVVTGASRGIGYHIGKELAVRMPQATVYLTTRGQEQISNLEASLRMDIASAADNVCFRRVDLVDNRSISKFVDVVIRKHKRLDILVNNAAVYHKPPINVHAALNNLPLYAKEVEEIMRCNYFGLKTLTKSFIPVLSKDSRIINIGSHLGLLSTFDVNDPAALTMKETFYSCLLSEDDIDQLVQTYIASVKKKNWINDGWPNCGYSFSKIAVNSYTKYLQDHLMRTKPDLNVHVNSVCPGTDHSKMTQSSTDTISVADSVDAICYLATIGLTGLGDCTSSSTVPKGEILWHDLSPTDWSTGLGTPVVREVSHGLADFEVEHAPVF